MELTKMSRAELEAFKNDAQAKYDDYKAKGLSLNMARGKPCTQQLDLTDEMLGVIAQAKDCYDQDATDCRNYGGVDGLPQAKKLFAPMLGVEPDQIIIGGSSSLNMMYDTIVKFMFFGVNAQSKPWKDQGRLKWLCPCPGYDRHFLVTQSFDFEMINIPMNADGPDMDMIEKLVAQDESIKGIWCVPMYSNPTGITFSDEVVKRFANMKTKADDFRIFWDNAYCVHHLTDTPDKLLDLLAECDKAGNPDRTIEFASTSKITYAGAGVAMMASSIANIDYIRSLLTVQTIGPDKLNQLRHVKFFKNLEGLTEHMKKHRELLEPRFNAVLDGLEKQIAPYGIGSWSKPNGGYFISFDAPDGCAKRIVHLCKEAGVVLTGAGATFPYGKDPKDSNIRLAPSYPPVEELKLAVEIFTTAVKLASAEKLLAQM